MANFLFCLAVGAREVALRIARAGQLALHAHHGIFVLHESIYGPEARLGYALAYGFHASTSACRHTGAQHGFGVAGLELVHALLLHFELGQAVLMLVSGGGGRLDLGFVAAGLLA